MICILSLHDALPIWLRSFAASWLLNALLRIFAMSIITPKRKVLRMSVQRSEERFSRNAETDLVCRLLLEKKKAIHDVPQVTAGLRPVPRLGGLAGAVRHSLR